MLEILQLQAGYDEKVIVEMPKFALSSGEHCLILGASGSGKTTSSPHCPDYLHPLAERSRLTVIIIKICEVRQWTCFAAGILA